MANNALVANHNNVIVPNLKDVIHVNHSIIYLHNKLVNYAPQDVQIAVKISMKYK